MHINSKSREIMLNKVNIEKRKDHHEIYCKHTQSNVFWQFLTTPDDDGTIGLVLPRSVSADYAVPQNYVYCCQFNIIHNKYVTVIICARDGKVKADRNSDSDLISLVPIVY